MTDIYATVERLPEESGSSQLAMLQTFDFLATETRIIIKLGLKPDPLVSFNHSTTLIYQNVFFLFP